MPPNRTASITEWKKCPGTGTVARWESGENCEVGNPPLPVLEAVCVCRQSDCQVVRMYIVVRHVKRVVGAVRGSEKGEVG